MKKRYLVVTIFLMFLLFMVFAYAGPDDIWKECSDANDASSDTDHLITIGSTDYYCCYNDGAYEWQSQDCTGTSLCIDNDGDSFVQGNVDVSLCEDVCGPNGNGECEGNNDCDDNTLDDTDELCPDDPIHCSWARSTCAICINPNLPEMVCDGIDNDCNHIKDEGCDDDDDGYADFYNMGCFGSFLSLLNGDELRSCEDYDGDCEDNDPVNGVAASDINPDATEICDGIDNNCKGICTGDGTTVCGLVLFACRAAGSEGTCNRIDEGCDNDGDGYADSSMTCTGSFRDGNGNTPSCGTNSGDCDDTNPDINPNAPEICDGIDNNCNNDNGDYDTLSTTGIDEGCDDDGDGYADSSMTCTGSFRDGNGNTPDCADYGGDCADNDPVNGVAASDINPNAPEVCDNIDNDCDGICRVDGTTICTTDSDCSSGICNKVNEGSVCPDDDDCTPDFSCSILGCGNTDSCGNFCGSCPPEDPITLTGTTCSDPTNDCPQSECAIESCNADGECVHTIRSVCDSTECLPGQFCDASGSGCKTPDESSDVCLNCADSQPSNYGGDQTSGSWTWIPPNHQDAGIGFGTELFNSDAGPCSTASGGSCYDSDNNPVNHKPAITTGACCGNDANEFYKPDYHGPECTGDVNDCVWSTGDTQAHNTGNAEYWCLEKEWFECIADTDIGTHVSSMICAGTSGNAAWTPSSSVLPEDEYSGDSCTDGLDNDGNGQWDGQPGDNSDLACCIGISDTDATCDGWDDNCDGTRDEDYVPIPTTCGAGVCEKNGFMECIFGIPEDSCQIDPTCCITIYRECKEYVGDAGAVEGDNDDERHTSKEKFKSVYHRDYDENEDIEAIQDTVEKSRKINIRKQIVGNQYYACEPDNTDSGCCINPNSCVYNAQCYDDRDMADVDNEGINEICIASSPGEWVDAGTIFGNVKDANGGIGGAKVEAIQGSSVMYEVTTSYEPDIGDYEMNNILYGTYDLVASADGYVSSTETNIVLDENQNIHNVDFTLVLGTTCEDDCTYASDNTIHRECDGIDNSGADIDGDGRTDCSFFKADLTDDGQAAREACDLAQPGWIRDYINIVNCPEGNCEIECAEGTPQQKREVKAKITCEKENLIKMTKVVTYKGKLVKLVIVTCG
jgi:hypothetical protein